MPTQDALLALVPLVLSAAAHGRQAPPPPQDPAAPGGPPGAAAAEPDEPRGLRVAAKPGALEGLTLVWPLQSGDVHLIDLAGEIVHTWKTGLAPGGAVRLLDDGTLLHGGREENNPRFFGGGIGGRIRRLDPQGKVLWDYVLADAQHTQHHDMIRLANGNVLMIAWQHHPPEDAIAAGRDPAHTSDKGFWTDSIFEVRPTPPQGGEIVWAWHSWDHLVQDADPKRPNHGEVAEHPGRFDVNGDHRREPPLSAEEKRRQAELEKEMRALGYVGGDEGEPAAGAKGGKPNSGDWLHTNSLALHEELDLLVCSSPHLDEVYVIDHSTTTAEARTEKGGRWGRGGALLYRWGNPLRWGMGTKADRRLFAQHDATWIAGEKPGELRLQVFNNGSGRPGKEFSSVDELVLPFDPKQGFVRDEGWPFGPAEPAWTYSDPADFYSPFISGAQRLPNGNTLVCEGRRGRVFEVTRAGAVVWDWLNPHGGEIPPSEQAGKAPPKALFRATRFPKDHPALAAIRAAPRAAR